MSFLDRIRSKLTESRHDEFARKVRETTEGMNPAIVDAFVACMTAEVRTTGEEMITFASEYMDHIEQVMEHNGVSYEVIETYMQIVSEAVTSLIECVTRKSIKEEKENGN